MKITFACIVFNGEYVLKQLIESIYPFAHKIIFVDGVVDYWAKQGFSGSVDNTIKIIKSFPDPYKKIILHEKVICKEKTELCNTFMKSVPEDTDYLWCIDSDEIFKGEDILKTKEILKTHQPDSISFQAYSFFTGFKYVLGGFERNYSIKRILKYQKGATYIEHRPPTLSCENKINPKHITHLEMASYDIFMYHYSYVFPKQVHDKVDYYKKCISLHNCIDNYFENIWLKWTLHPELREQIENEYNGVHEFIPSYRGECRTELFTGTHPYSIQKSIPELQNYFNLQLNEYR